LYAITNPPGAPSSPAIAPSAAVTPSLATRSLANAKGGGRAIVADSVAVARDAASLGDRVDEDSSSDGDPVRRVRDAVREGVSGRPGVTVRVGVSVIVSSCVRLSKKQRWRFSPRVRKFAGHGVHRSTKPPAEMLSRGHARQPAASPPLAPALQLK
jgi:hypothetical protein